MVKFVHFSMTMMATDSAVTALSVATAFIVMCTPLSVVTTTTLVFTVMLQRCHCRCCSVVSLHRNGTNVAAILATAVHSTVKYTAVTNTVTATHVTLVAIAITVTV